MAGSGPPPANIPDPYVPSKYATGRYEPDQVRAVAFYCLLALFIVTVLSMGIEVSIDHWGQVREFAGIVLATESLLLGTAMGFFFSGGTSG